MLRSEQKEDFSSKITRYLANPSAAQEPYAGYQEEHEDASYEEYTQALEELSNRLNKDDFDDAAAFCQEVKRLHLPDNQFDCGESS